MRGNPLPTQSWAVQDGMITTQQDGSGGDLRTVAEYSDFDLRWEWKIAEKGNSGIKYNVQEEWISFAFRPGAPESRRERWLRQAIGFE